MRETVKARLDARVECVPDSPLPVRLCVGGRVFAWSAGNARRLAEQLGEAAGGVPAVSEADVRLIREGADAWHAWSLEHRKQGDEAWAGNCARLAVALNDLADRLAPTPHGGPE